MEQLLAAGAKLQLPDTELCSALCGAVDAGQEQLLRRFIAAGADVSAADHNKQTALHLAAAQGKLKLVSSVCFGTRCCFRVWQCLAARVWHHLCMHSLVANQQPAWFGLPVSQVEVSAF